ncbi:ORM1-like protein [Hamiltosporidium tvaerminnensis]|uniref:ORM1-like protein n=2 Tax=Hamiltosporidium TaxID=1176354 RepID=A0A4V2JUD8_9MICR|nr:ORM1-like protein [Hamiltosporidium magnivora]TBU00121.1 ORM1-like protein [Hamiltosporidium tvaerminnensis]TBU02783.1 ORM1-like protein [Hamiltosporidium magnivora]TBU03150.1 ORM1-like protein [Hamiltosporidium tvaerminnensis]TBU11378.1 ORM1-like protein [Hamiltosporidium tvaerminnensis]
MKQPVIPSGVSQNVAWTLQKGSWITHITVTILVKVLYAQLFNPNLSWQLTILTYNFCSFIFFHWIIGDPFDHQYCGHTFWEQMTEQLENSPSLIFLCVYPVVLFIIGNHIVEWNAIMFYLCVFSLCIVIIPKFGFMHRKRLFGIRGDK